MRKLEMSSIFTVLAAITFVTARRDDNTSVQAETKQNWKDTLPTHQANFAKLGLAGSAASLKKVLPLVERDNLTYKELYPPCEEVRGRLIDETESERFFSLSLAEADWYSNPRRGWEFAIDRFPQILDDVEEAAKCFAVSRYAAAVFHSVQAIEFGLIEFGKFLKVNDPHSGWTAVAGALQKVIDKKHQDRSRFERKNFAFLEQMQGLVQGLKNAWRNKISHSHGRLVLISKEFSPEVAEEILMASRAFVRRLAEELPPAKPKKRASKK